MDRVAATDGTAAGNTRSVDRSAPASLPTDRGASGASSLGPARPEPVLSGPTEALTAAPHADAEVILQRLWFDLPVPDRQRFGHCFSCMVLKALGLRPSLRQEVQA